MLTRRPRAGVVDPADPVDPEEALGRDRLHDEPDFIGVSLQHHDRSALRRSRERGPGIAIGIAVYGIRMGAQKRRPLALSGHFPTGRAGRGEEVEEKLFGRLVHGKRAISVGKVPEQAIRACTDVNESDGHTGGMPNSPHSTPRQSAHPAEPITDNTGLTPAAARLRCPCSPL